MTDSAALLADLKVQLRALRNDLKDRVDNPDTTGDPTAAWGARLRAEHAEALARERTGLSWTAWRDNEIDQAAVGWLVATTFVRFCEDNDLLVGARLAGLPADAPRVAGDGSGVRRLGAGGAGNALGLPGAPGLFVGAGRAAGPIRVFLSGLASVHHECRGGITS